MSIQYTADQLQRKFPGPPGSPGFARLADTLRADGRWDEAIQLCQEGLRLRPFQLSGYLVLGKTLVEAGRLEEAREQFEGALRLDPRCLSAMHALANILSQLNWADGAAGYYRSILAVEPWDRQIRDMLGDAPASSLASSSSSDATAFTPAGEFSKPVNQMPQNPAETFERPSGFQGDVMEIDLHEVADFLPADGPGAEELSLEEALSDTPADFSPTRSSSPLTIDTPPEPLPKDILKSDAMDGDGVGSGAPAPISGQDVEDRLDSLFGEDDSTPSPSASATWTAAPAARDSQGMPSDLGSATATDFLRAADVGDATTIQTDALRLPPEPSDPTSLSAGQDEITGTEFAAPDPEDRVQGQDIEDRLDALFNLNDGEADFPAAPAAAATALGSMTEALDLSDPGTGTLPAIEADTHEGQVETMAVARDTAGSGQDIGAIEDLGLENPTAEEPGLHDTDVVIALENSRHASDEPMVTGADVADKLDDLFGVEATAPAARKPEPMPEWKPTPSVTDRDEGMDPVREQGATFAGGPKAPADAAGSPAVQSPTASAWGEAPPPPEGDLMSTESMLPMGWLSDSGPQITGADIEEQLDKLFQMEDGVETLAAPSGNMEATVTQLERETPGAMPGDEADKTITMPAMRDTAPREPAARDRVAGEAVPRNESVPRDAGLKESVTDWLSRQNDAEQGNETMILPGEENPIIVGDDIAAAIDATLELPAGTFSEESFGTLAPEEATNLTDTTSIEMVDGTDVAERLDELFSSKETESTGAETLGLEISPDTGMPTEETLVSGAEVVARLDDMLGSDPSTSASASQTGTEERLMETGISDPMGVVSTQAGTPAELSPAGEPPVLDAFSSGIIEPLRLDDDALGEPMASAPALDGMANPPSAQAAKPAPILPPMQDEEDAFPADDEMPPQDGAGTNVATVTLAEIYFQQGLREQALQIYRQLLEREPGNDSVRKRIQEIEASKPDGDNRGPDSDPRRPRPGLKVPKRKK